MTTPRPAFSTASGQLSLSSAGQIWTVPVGGYESLSCEYTGDIGSGVVTIKRQVTDGVAGVWDYGTPIVFDGSTQRHFDIDTKGVGAIVFVVTTAASGKVIKINTLAARY